MAPRVASNRPQLWKGFVVGLLVGWRSIVLLSILLTKMG